MKNFPPPPLLGFPEEYIITQREGADFYTCVMGGRRIFVWYGLNMWVIQVATLSRKHTIEHQFARCTSQHYRVEQDPIALMAVIHEITSEDVLCQPRKCNLQCSCIG